MKIILCIFLQIVKWSDFCSPLAFKTGKPYILFAEASIDNFSSLGIAFLEDRLQMDNGMVPQKIVCKYTHLPIPNKSIYLNGI